LAKELRNKVRDVSLGILQPIQKGIFTAFALYNKILPKNLTYHYYILVYWITFQVSFHPWTRIALIKNMEFEGE